MGSEMLVRLDRIAIDFSMSDEHDQLTVSVPACAAVLKIGRSKSSAGTRARVFGHAGHQVLFGTYATQIVHGRIVLAVNLNEVFITT